MSMEMEIVNPEDGPCVRNLEDEVPLGSSSPIDRYTTPPPISSLQVNKSMKGDIPCERNDFTSGIKNNELDMCPVSPFTFGEGLPYAPVDWPNPGDTWSWKVGRRVNKSGYYVDRYLFLPRRLQKPSCRRQGFSSKSSVKLYIQEVDPTVDIAAFFGSFSWRIHPKRVTPTPITPGECSQSRKEVGQEEEKKIPYTFPRRKRKAAKLPVTTMYRRRTRQSTRWIPRVNAEDAGIIDLCSLSKESETSDPTNQDLRNATDLECDQVSSHKAPFSPATDFEYDQVSSHQAPISPATDLECDYVSSLQAPISPASDFKCDQIYSLRAPISPATDFECDQVSSHHAPISPVGNFVADSNSPVSCDMPQKEFPQGTEDKVTPEDFDKFLDSLDDMLAKPLPEAALSQPAADNYQFSEDEIAEARSKLSSILALDFHLLVSSKDLEELPLLSSKVQKDPSLNAEQLSKLKLIEEIPATAKDFLETMQIMEEVDKFFADRVSKMDKATLLRNEYNTSKEDIARLQADINSSLSNIEEIDDQIAKLQSRRAELTTDIEMKNEEVTKLTTTQRMVADSLPWVVHEVQLANTNQPEWEQKKKNAKKRETKILEKIALLREFTL